MYYTEKIVVSGKFLELYKYKKAVSKGFKKNKKKPLSTEPKQLEIDFSLPKIFTGKREDSIALTRTKIRRLVNSNMDFDKFTTLTFAENMQDIHLANSHFHKFIMRLKHNYGDFKYLAVIEFQKRGAVHYHFLNNLPYIKSKELELVWGHGFVKPKKIAHVDNLGAYICKYLHKDMQNENMFHQKKFFYSRNLERPEMFYDRKQVMGLKDFYNLDCAKFLYETTFENDYIGEVEYKQFNLEKLTA